MSEIEVVYEEDGFAAINKPAGLLVHPVRMKHGVESKEATLVGWLRERFPEVGSVGDDTEFRPGIVHRLDKATSGVMLVARTQQYFEYLKTLFQNGEIKKTYLAVVRGDVVSDNREIDKPIGIKTGSTKRSVHSEKMLKRAVTEYKVIQRSADNNGNHATLLEVTPKTGRTHQIRVHLASIGHPIVGDMLYGKDGSAKSHHENMRLMLHALSLEFSTTEGKRIKVEAEPPEDFNKLLSYFVAR